MYIWCLAMVVPQRLHAILLECQPIIGCDFGAHSITTPCTCVNNTSCNQPKQSWNRTSQSPEAKNGSVKWLTLELLAVWLYAHYSGNKCNHVILCTQKHSWNLYTWAMMYLICLAIADNWSPSKNCMSGLSNSNLPISSFKFQIGVEHR